MLLLFTLIAPPLSFLVCVAVGRPKEAMARVHRHLGLEDFDYPAIWGRPDLSEKDALQAVFDKW